MKATWRLITLCLVMAGLVACGTSSAGSPQGVADPAGGPVPVEMTVPGERVSDPAPVAFTPKAGLASEREQIILFTREALEIEAKRNAFMDYLTGLRKRFGREGSQFHVKSYYLSGISERRAQKLSLPTTYEGMLSLHSRLLLLDVPQVLDPIKDSLVNAYSNEIDIVSCEVGLGRGCMSAYTLGINKDNIMELPIQPFEPGSMKYTRWGGIQVLRLCSESIPS